MYIRIGNDKTPLDLKVSGGFKVESPILKVIGYQVQTSMYFGTPEAAFKKEQPAQQLPFKPTVSVNVAYFKSYEDYLNLETPIMFTPEPNIESVLNNNFYGLTLEGEITQKTIYEALKAKIAETFSVVSIVNE